MANQRGLASRTTAILILIRILDDQRHFDSLTDESHGLVSYLKLEMRDRALVKAMVSVALRRLGQIDDALSRLHKRPPPHKARWLIHCLRIAAAQILFLDVPDHAAISLAVASVKADRRTNRFTSFANALLRRLSREKSTILEDQDECSLNMPSWFRDRLTGYYSRQTTMDIGRMHLMLPNLDISVKKDPDFWAQALQATLLPTGSLRRPMTSAITKLEGFGEGAWWVQDSAASLPVRLFGDLSACSALDLCAAPGGKTAQLILAGAQVTAIEKSPRRLQRLQENLDRLRLDARLVTADFLDWKTDETFDVVLLDAPCSASGTIRRHPDILWTKTQAHIQQLVKLQKTMLAHAVRFVKPEGILIFTNCSIDPAEGEFLCRELCNENDRLQLIPINENEVFGMSEWISPQGYLRTLPCMMKQEPEAQGGMDGFFAARFRIMPQL